SPVAAVSGNAAQAKAARRPIALGGRKIETTLGVHHAAGARKTLLLMTGSFALSILLFLGFSALIDFVGCLLPQSVAASDIS
ncbi:hypothetical protein RF400_21110, partial [Acinetobacter baumannii]|nr:hypothetical protein [Acinetobacter baumannii]